MPVEILWTQQATSKNVNLSWLVLSGVLDRFPQLQLTLVDTAAGWLPTCGELLDWNYRYAQFLAFARLRLRPSDYIKRQVKATIRGERSTIGVPARRRRREHDVVVGLSAEHLELAEFSTSARRIVRHIFQQPSGRLCRVATLPRCTASKASTSSRPPDSSRSMARVIVNRLLLTVPLLLLVTMAAFLIGELTPGDHAQVIAGDFATPEAIEQVREELAPRRPRTDALRALARRRVVTATWARKRGRSARCPRRCNAGSPVTASLALSSLVISLLIGFRSASSKA